MTVDVSIVVVNFNAAGYIVPLYESLKPQEFTVDGRPGTWELVILDNASRGEDASVLRELAVDPRVRYFQNVRNTGYAQANNQGYHVARGRYHMVLNPDTLAHPGCLRALVDHLEKNPDTAMVGPAAYMDPECTVYMPPNELPTPEWFETQVQAQESKEAALENIRRRTKFSYPYWTTSEPIAMQMLSGCCVMFRRELYADTWPFDPGYPLYYEDTDMFMALFRKGLRMVHVSAAKITHHFSRSAYTHTKGAQYRHGLSEERYFKKFFPGPGYAAYKASHDRLWARIREGKAVADVYDFEPVRAAAKPPEFYVDMKYKNYYAEISGNPIFTLAAAMFPTEEGWFTLTNGMWESLGYGTYWVRTVDKTTLETQQAWVVHKQPAL